jgi:hypothetical protein
MPKLGAGGICAHVAGRIATGEKKRKIFLDMVRACRQSGRDMGEDFTLDYMTGFVFGILAFFGAYSFTVMFKAFRLPGDAA